jgi:hypothetical protein
MRAPPRVLVRAQLSAAGRAVLLEVRVMHTAQEGAMRRTQTPHGPVGLPALDTARVRTTLTLPLPLGQTALVAATSRPGARRVLMFATPRLVRRATPR